MRQATFRESKKTIFETIIQVAQKLDLEVTEESLADGRVELLHKSDLLSYGNNIGVMIKPIEAGKITVKVESRSSASVQLFDWGTNDKLESRFLETLKESLSE